MYSIKHSRSCRFVWAFILMFSGAIFHHHISVNYNEEISEYSVNKKTAIFFSSEPTNKKPLPKDHKSLQEINQYFQSISSNRSNQVFIPRVYRKDLEALQKYLTYLNRSEPPLPLQTKAVIILTNYRSGSSFLGELFNQHPDVFYFFEPLYITSDWWKCSDNVLVQKQMMENLAQCIVPNWKQIYNELHSDTSHLNNNALTSCTKMNFCFAPFTKELTTEEHCPRSVIQKGKHNPWEHCGAVNLNLAANACRRKKLVAMKVIRACHMKLFEEIATKHNVDLKIVHLLRDPRGVASSRLLLHKRISLTNSFNFTCRRQLQNLNIGLLEQPLWLKGKYKIFRYEDLALKPFETAQKLYEFIGLDFPKVVEEWIVNNTQIGSDLSNKAEEKFHSPQEKKPLNVKKSISARDPWSRRRDSKSVVYQWQHHLTFSQVKEIENQCADVMKMLGYIPVKDQTEYAQKSNLNLVDADY